ncbi:hypothetical protein KPL74_05365 [Bacillus sp. NP157]|nr:hypothetical protein KPL74_05365 [Bacillus sp. NP157]
MTSSHRMRRRTCVADASSSAPSLSAPRETHVQMPARVRSVSEARIREGILETAFLLSGPNRDHLLASIAELRAGKGVEHALVDFAD